MDAGSLHPEIFTTALVSGGSLSGLTTSDSIVIQRDLNYLGIKSLWQ